MTINLKNIVKVDFGLLSENQEEIDFTTSSSMTEEFRSIKRALLSAAFDVIPSERIKNRIMVTSVNRGEGKSFVSGNLAKSISLERGKHTLLVDANVQHPTISAIVTPKLGKGLIDFLCENVSDISDCIADTDIPGLKILPVGVNNYLANELLSSDMMTNLMSEFNTRYDDRIIIIDSPHINGVNETLAIAKNVDQIIVIIEEGKTKVSDIKRAHALLPRGVKIHYLINKTLHVNPWNTSTPINESNKLLTVTSN